MVQNYWILPCAPGVSIVPTGMSTIDFHPHDETEIDPIADNIDRFFNKVEASGRSKNVFDACNRDKTWGYYEKEPCVFVKLNKVYGFEPETYESESELPKDSPSEIADLMAQYGGFAKIWLTCDATDEENSPSINYIPYPYFDTSTDMKGLNRVVALQLSEIPTNEDITIICKVWAKNIHIDMEYRGTGHTKFTIKMRGKA
ncbi:sodium/potassium-transporting ATPase subunit beta-like [Drosophila albomicans]|uniref:Sodium/potassium-transporting ATPase subunit beta-like n=1 Tax=Drosophila albomicans TaxID=7291 RepID=A0A6P8Z8U6_DROAB|nr:sodium/potassium-transporting ATPase subunit beta-like [Drosophila albomicans]